MRWTGTRLLLSAHLEIWCPSAGIYLSAHLEFLLSAVTHTNGICYYYSNGRSWYQDSVWYVAWGAATSLPVPEIYYQSQANEWGQIYFWKAMGIRAPLDEYDLDTRTFTSSQAWTALWNATGGFNMTYSDEIHVMS